ncbi:MAG TPA: hypothetical protein VGO67_00140 [Verrucomicrobiae bacterium]|jgi:hypothetical protein
MKFPVKVTFCKAEAKIYGKSTAYPFYRLCYYAAGKRHIRSFSTYGAARKETDTKVKDFADGNQSIALTPREATAALSIRDMLWMASTATLGADCPPWKLSRAIWTF